MNKKNLKISKMETVIALFLAFTISASMFALPAANAHTPPWTIPTYAFLNVSPNPVGVGQEVTINFWIDKTPPSAYGTYGYVWQNMTVTMTEPNGDVITLNMGPSNTVGGTVKEYTLDQLGNYTFVGNFPTQTVTNVNPYPYPEGALPFGLAYINDTYTASTSSVVTVTVQQEAILPYPSTPLPTGYWQRPINAMNNNWYSIGGNWLSGNFFNVFGDSFEGNGAGLYAPYTTAPNSAHILWTKPLAFGGQIGGEFGPLDTSIYATGTAYEPKFNPVIMNGILYYTQFPGAETNPGPLTAVDLRTGETLWTQNATYPLMLGQIQQFISESQYGAHSYIWTAPAQQGWTEPLSWLIGPEWSMYDAMTGEWILNIANVSSGGTLVEGPNGEVLSYSVAGGNLTMWNSTKCIEAGSAANVFYLIYSSIDLWRPPQGVTINWSAGNQWSVPLPTTVNGVPINSPPNNLPLSIAAIDHDTNTILLSNLPGIFSGSTPGGSQFGWQVVAAVSATDGHLLWGPINETLPAFTNTNGEGAAEGVYIQSNEQMFTYTAYNITTGAELWTTQLGNNSYDYFNGNDMITIANGNAYVDTFGGQVYCLDLETGVQKWVWSTGSSGVNTPYGIYPIWPYSGPLVADGKVYIVSDHDYTPPLYKGAQLYCLNATTGEEIWSILDFGSTQFENGRTAIADGILLSYNNYDNQIYAFGKGPSKTTVTAPDIGVTTGTPITITGTVTDISAGASQQAVAANFPNGLPCISDASMSQFMEAVYEQQTMPTNITGVPVTLSAIDPNHNYVTLGTTTSDASGFYSFAVNTSQLGAGPGKYTVIATFPGSNSYYSSYSETAFTVAPDSTAAALTPTTASVVSIYFLPAVIAIIIVIIIIGAIIMLMLSRKRP